MSAIQQSSIISHVAPQKCTPTQDASVSYYFGGWANLSVADQSLPHEVSHDIYGQGEDDGGVLLRRDGVEGLQVAKLQGWGRLCDHEGRLLQGAGGVHLALCRNNLQIKNEILQHIYMLYFSYCPLQF